MIRFICCDFLNGTCPKSADECEHEHRNDSAKPCDKGDSCPNVHYKRKWVPVKKTNKCQVSTCGRRFSQLFPWRRQHHCRGCGIVTCLSCLDKDYIPFPACTDCKLVYAKALAEQRKQARLAGFSTSEIEQQERQQIEHATALMKQQQQNSKASHAQHHGGGGRRDVVDDEGFVVVGGEELDDDDAVVDDEEDTYEFEEDTKQLLLAADEAKVLNGRSGINASAFYNLRDLLLGSGDEDDERGAGGGAGRHRFESAAARAARLEQEAFEREQQDDMLVLSPSMSGAGGPAGSAQVSEDIEMLFRPLVGVSSIASFPRFGAAAGGMSRMSSGETRDDEDEAISILFRPLYLPPPSAGNGNAGSPSFDSNSGGGRFAANNDDDDDLVPSWERAKRKMRCLPPVLRMANASKSRVGAAAAGGRGGQALAIEEAGRLRSEQEERDEIGDLFRGGTFRDADVARSELLKHQRQLNENLFTSATSRSWLMTYQLPSALKEEREREQREQRARLAAEERQRQLEQWEQRQQALVAQRQQSFAARRTASGVKSRGGATAAAAASSSPASAVVAAQPAAPASEPAAIAAAATATAPPAVVVDAVAAAAPVDVVSIEEKRVRARERAMSLSRDTQKPPADEKQAKAMAAIQSLDKEPGFRRLLRRFGVEMLILLVLVAAIVGSIGLLINFAMKHFVMFRGCHECFLGGGVAFSESQQLCVYEANLSKPFTLPPAPLLASNSTTTGAATATTTSVPLPPATTLLSNSTLSVLLTATATTRPGPRLAFNSSERLVSTRSYCGAPECLDVETVPLLTPIPYSVMFVGTVIGICVTALVNVVKKSVLLPAKEIMCGYIDPSRLMTKESRSLLFRLHIFGAVDPVWFCVLWAGNIANFILIIRDVVDLEPRPIVTFNQTTGEFTRTYEELKKDSFHLFEAIYLRWLNAGSTVQVLLIFFCQLLNATVGVAFVNKCKCPKAERTELGDGERSVLAKLVIPLGRLFGERRALFAHWFLLPLPLMPIIVTHVIPGAVIFPTTAIMLLGTYAICGWLFTKKRMKERVWSKGAQILWLLLFRVVGNLTMLCFLQTSANLMQLVYQQGISNFRWDAVLTREFERRSTYCWTVGSANKISNANIGLAELLLS